MFEKVGFYNSVFLKVGEGRVAKVADFGLTRDVYIDEAYWKRSSGKCKLLPILLLLIQSPPSHPVSPHLSLCPQCQ